MTFKSYVIWYSGSPSLEFYTAIKESYENTYAAGIWIGPLVYQSPFSDSAIPASARLSLFQVVLKIRGSIEVC